jgi:hypothetical protein
VRSLAGADTHVRGCSLALSIRPRVSAITRPESSWIIRTSPLLQGAVAPNVRQAVDRSRAEQDAAFMLLSNSGRPVARAWIGTRRLEGFFQPTSHRRRQGVERQLRQGQWLRPRRLRDRKAGVKRDREHHRPRQRPRTHNGQAPPPGTMCPKRGEYRWACRRPIPYSEYSYRKKAAVGCSRRHRA